MEVYRGIDRVPAITSSFLTVGSFDGLHRGHQEIVKKVAAYARSHRVPSVVLTFDPHPRHVLNPGMHLPLLMSIDRKLVMLESLGIDITVVIPFTPQFARVTAAEFIDDIIVAKFAPRHIVIGYDHHFGRDRTGSPEFIRDYLRSRSLGVEVVPPVHDEDRIISSTHIRELLQGGHVRRASFELGWVYGFAAQVVPGVGRGRRLTFPTANFVPLEPDQLLPGSGVYLARGRLNSENSYGMCNLGTRPTFAEKRFVMEVHFFEAPEEELYGSQITIEFLERIRDERKFDTPQALIKQLKDDKKQCFELLSKY